MMGTTDNNNNQPPIKPDWHNLAITLADAYIDAVKAQERAAKGDADGLECWTAINRLQKALESVLTWHKYPELYGSLLAKQQQQESESAQNTP